MQIGIDIDGVIVDLMHAFREVIAIDYNIVLRHRDITEYELKKIIPWFTGDIFNTLCIKHRLYANALPEPGALDGMAYLYRNHDLHLISARPTIFMEQTLSWFRKNNVRYDTLHLVHRPEIGFYHPDDGVFGESPKVSVCQDLRLDLFIEDATHHATSIGAQNIPVIIFDQPWNQQWTGMRACSWKEITNLVDQLLL